MVVIPKLSKLKVYGLKKLEQIWASSSEADNVSMLKEIEIYDCNSLVNLFPSNPMRLLTHLEDLKVGRCCSIEVLFNIDLGKIEQHISYTSNLRRIEVTELEELKEVWRIHEVNNYDHLIVGFQAVKTIIIQTCKTFRNVFTPVKANFDMRGLMNIRVDGVKDAEIDGISKEDDNMSIVGFPSYHLTRAFNQIHWIWFDGLKKAEVVFEIERQSTTNTEIQPPPLLPCLESLILLNMDKMSHVWKCSNWNDFFILHKHQPQSSFQNLTDIYLWECKNIKYLFSPLMSKLLSSLNTLKIRNCEGIEEVVSNRDDDDDDEALTTSTTTLFPCLDYLELRSLNNLKHISGGGVKGKTNVVHDKFKFSQAGVVSWFLCQYPTEIYVESCPSLSILIPSNAALQMQKLQKLTIEDCPSMVEVFESKNINNNIVYSSNIDQTSVSLARPTTTTMHHELTNLRILSISECDLLEYIFTFSTLECLKKLEELGISSCKAMKVIVKEEHEEELSKVVMPRLKSIRLYDLPILEGLFVGTNIDIEWPSLDYVMIDDCPQMMMFTSGKSTAPKLNFIHTLLGKHNLERGLNFHQMTPSSSNSVSWSFHNLVELHLECEDEVKKIVPDNELLQLHVLEKISVEDCDNVEEAFEVTDNESQTVVKIPKLREMNLEYLANLQYIWKSNQWSKLEFPNLTRLSIYYCPSLEHVLTASMVGSLMQLQELHIGKCKNLNVIVKKKQEECDVKVGEIEFPCLKFLKLDNLSSLNGFCLEEDDFLFSSLNTLVIKNCPEIRIFTMGRSFAPKLEQVKTTFGIFDVGEDINSFVTSIIGEGFNF